MNENVGLFLRYENRTCFKSEAKKYLPVTLITGFLGAGKTTLLNYLVTNKQQLRIAAAVNDFASLNIDSELIHISKLTVNGHNLPRIPSELVISRNLPAWSPAREHTLSSKLVEACMRSVLCVQRKIECAALLSRK